MGQKNPLGAGTICGRARASSLAQIPIPASLAGQCIEGYTANNTVLDLLVGGCVVYPFQTVNRTQPDTGDPTMPIAGAGPPYSLAANGTHIVTTCRDLSGTEVPLDTCLSSAAYSAYLKFATDRVIIK
jgi:hypothetical protein